MTTLPQSPIPQDRQMTWSVVSMYEANKPYDRPWIVYATRFPILRSSPLWRQTWVEIVIPGRLIDRNDESGWSTYLTPRVSGYFFPPLSCSAAIPGMGLRSIYRLGYQERIFSSPSCRCPDCLRSADAIEIMLVGIAWAVQQWPEEWEHRCWFSVERPWCHVCDWQERYDCSFVVGNASVLDLAYWRTEMDDSLERILSAFRFTPGRSYRIVMSDESRTV